MTSRERVFAAIAHQTPDRIPVDLGATPSSGISAIAYSNLATSIKGLGEHTKIGGSILVMAIVGGVVCTPLMGYIAEFAGSMAIAMCVPLLAYVYVLYFSSLNRKTKIVNCKN